MVKNAQGHAVDGVVTGRAFEAGGPMRKRILLSAFACSPLWGSEPGVGWRWLIELVRRHDVTLVTHAYFRAHLEGEIEKRGLRGLSIVYVDAPEFGLSAERYLNSRLYYLWWQWRLRRVVRALLDRTRHDLVHHLTWGTFRLPASSADSACHWSWDLLVAASPRPCD